MANRLLPNDRTLTELDAARLLRLQRQGAALPVAELLDSASLVPSREVPPDVVTMYSQLRVLDAAGSEQQLTLCYPDDAEPARGFISVLSPVGLALLGLRVGSVARWRPPDGAQHSAEIVALSFQPEASGDYTT